MEALETLVDVLLGLSMQPREVIIVKISLIMITGGTSFLRKKMNESSKSLKQSLKSLSTITLRCTYQEKLTMEEVKWNGFPSVGTFQLFKSICSFLWHFKNIYLIFLLLINFFLTRYHVCLVVAYDKASGKAHRF